MFVLNEIMHLIVVLFIGPCIFIVLLANLLDMEDALPGLFNFPHVEAEKVLGFHAQPVILYDVEEKHEPLGVLFLGGTSDLYMLYDPCTEVVRLVAVSLSGVELMDRVTCPTP